MSQRLQWFIHLRAQGLSKGDVRTLLMAMVHFLLDSVIGPILWGHSGPLCHALSLLLLLLSLWTSILHCHSPGVVTVARRLRYCYSWLRLILVVVSTVAKPGEWQCKIRTGGVRRLAVANGPNIFQMLFVEAATVIGAIARIAAAYKRYS